MRRLIAVLSSLPLTLALLPGQESPPQPKAAPETVVPALHGAFDQVLRRHVRDGLVNYEGIRREDAKALLDYLQSMAEMDIEKLSPAERFASYVNVYNATMIQAVLERSAGHPEWTPAANDFVVFRDARVRLRGRTITLNELENDVLRKGYADPRVHVALVCGASSCPRLLSRAYEGADLERVLEENLHTFLHDGLRNQIDHDEKTVRLSKIFEWYRGDFGGEAGIRKLLQRQFNSAVAAYRIEYLEYSWELNRQPEIKKE